MERASMLQTLREYYNTTVPAPRQTPEHFQAWVNQLSNFELVIAIDASIKHYTDKTGIHD